MDVHVSCMHLKRSNTSVKFQFLNSLREWWWWWWGGVAVGGFCFEEGGVSKAYFGICIVWIFPGGLGVSLISYKDMHAVYEEQSTRSLRFLTKYTYPSKKYK